MKVSVSLYIPMTIWNTAFSSSPTN